MPNTFSQIYIQVVFAVRGRENLISKKWKDELYKYICGIVKAKKEKVCERQISMAGRIRSIFLFPIAIR